VAPGSLDPYIIGQYWLKVTNNVFNSVRHALSYSPITLPSISSVAPCCWVTLHCSGVRTGGQQRWRCTVDACPHVDTDSGACLHVLQALAVVPVRTVAVGRAGDRSPPHREAGSGATRQVVLRSPSSGSDVSRHVVASEPTLTGRRGMEPLDMWQFWIPPRLEGRI
jgi:hypothetical protein